MRIFNENKTEVLKYEELDLTKGKLVNDTITHHIDAVEGKKEISHYETVKEYPNGGKEVRKVIDQAAVEAVDAHDEVEEIQVYIPYTEAELQKMDNERKIAELKQQLSASDYKAIKYAEGWLTEEEYAPIKSERQALRDQINSLEH